MTYIVAPPEAFPGDRGKALQKAAEVADGYPWLTGTVQFRTGYACEQAGDRLGAENAYHDAVDSLASVEPAARPTNGQVEIAFARFKLAALLTNREAYSAARKVLEESAEDLKPVATKVAARERQNLGREWPWESPTGRWPTSASGRRTTAPRMPPAATQSNSATGPAAPEASCQAALAPEARDRAVAPAECGGLAAVKKEGRQERRQEGLSEAIAAAEDAALSAAYPQVAPNHLAASPASSHLARLPSVGMRANPRSPRGNGLRVTDDRSPAARRVCCVLRRAAPRVPAHQRAGGPRARRSAENRSSRRPPSRLRREWNSRHSRECPGLSFRRSRRTPIRQATRTPLHKAARQSQPIRCIRLRSLNLLARSRRSCSRLRLPEAPLLLQAVRALHRGPPG